MEETHVSFIHPDFSYFHVRSSPPHAEYSFHHCHEFYELIYVKNGIGKCIVEGLEYNLSPHSLLLIFPREYHYVVIKDDQEYERYVFNFERRLLPSVNDADCLCLGDGFSGASRFYDTESVYSTLIDLFQRTDNTACEETPCAFDHIRVFLSKILLLLSERAPQKNINDNDPLGTRVIRYLNKNITAPMTLDQLASRFFVTKPHLCRSFKERNGISVMDYLCRKRVLLAKQLISQGENAYAAAYHVGFNDYSTFFRAYKKVTNTSPLQQKLQRKDSFFFAK